MVRHFFLTIIGHIRHHASELLCTLDVNVVHANAVTDNALDVGERLQNAAGDELLFSRSTSARPHF